jgi:hypothetical protein
MHHALMNLRYQFPGKSVNILFSYILYNFNPLFLFSSANKLLNTVSCPRIVIVNAAHVSLRYYFSSSNYTISGWLLS